MKLSDVSGYSHVFFPQWLGLGSRVRGQRLGLRLGLTGRNHFQRDMIQPSHKHKV